MAGPHEIALGIASVLGKRGMPNSPPISFRGQTLDGAAEVVNAIISEYSDADIRIAKIELDPGLYRHIIAAEGHQTRVRLEPRDNLVSEVKIFAK